MTDEVETDAKTALADSKTVIATLETEETTAVTWVKAHTLILAVLGAFILGAIAGAVLVAKL